MQYRIGTVGVTNGSPTVSGDIQEWVANVSAGDLFLIKDDGVSYEIASVTDNDTLVLASNYAGVTGTGKTYAITNSFTPIYGIPYPESGDIETATIMKRAIMMIEAKLAELDV